MHTYLLWISVGAWCYCRSLGFADVQAMVAGALFFIPYLALNIHIQTVVLGFIFNIMDIFFSEIGSRGTQHMPLPGNPCIVAIAPHANQFIDPCVVMRVLNRPMNFLAAAKSMRKKHIAAFAKPLGAIAVERPEDLKQDGEGEINVSWTKVSGTNTRFKEIFQPGHEWFIVAADGEFRGCRAVVDAVESDTSLRLRAPFMQKDKTAVQKLSAAQFSAMPHLDHSAMFATVFDNLRMGHTVAIFPEGGSHDRTQLLPLKKGIAHMALGAAAKHPGLPINIVPVGLNYFSGHRFRSKVFVDVARPVLLPPRLVEMYKEGGAAKNQALDEAMEIVRSNLEIVTVAAPDTDTLQLFWALRRLYTAGKDGEHSEGGTEGGAGTHVEEAAKGIAKAKTQAKKAKEGKKAKAEGSGTGRGFERGSSGNETKLTMNQKLILVRAFAAGYEMAKNDARMKMLMEKVNRYSALLQRHGLRDHQVQHMDTGTWLETKVLLQNTGLLVLYAIGLLPFYIICFPFLLTTRHIAKAKAEEALAASRRKAGGSGGVKIKGKDVLATWKLMVSLVLLPVQHLLLSGAAYSLSGVSAAVAYFFFSPMVFYAGLLGNERALELYRTLVPMWMRLREFRCSLKQEVRAVVDHYRLLDVIAPSKYGVATAQEVDGIIGSPTPTHAHAHTD